MYDFGYAWPWVYGHLIPVVIFTVLAALAWKLKWSIWIKGISVFLVIWGVIGFAIVQLALRINLPEKLPTEQFLAAGSGYVLDAGAGSGRSTLMVLLERPDSRVLALDLYEGYYGIIDNTPERLLANAKRAGVEDRLEVEVGDIRDLPLDDNSLDAVVSVAVIDHLRPAGIEKSIAEIERVLRPNGEFLLMVVNNDVWIRIAYPFLIHHGYYGPRTNAEIWRSHLTKPGLEIIEQGMKPGSLYFLVRKKA